MEEKRGEKTYLLEAMRSNRRRIGLMVVPFFVVVAVFVALFALLLAPKEGR